MTRQERGEKMRRLLVSGLFFGLLVGCGANAPETTEPSKPETIDSTRERTPTPLNTSSPNSLNPVSFPQDSCGDSLPDNLNAYPVTFYPLYIESTSHQWTYATEASQELKVVRNEWCGNARMGYIKGGEEGSENYRKSVVILGYFSDKSQAERVRSVLSERLAILESQNLSKVNLGEPLMLEKPLPSTESIAEQAKLSPEDVRRLLALDKYSDLGLTVDVIVPTYLPEGFEVRSIEAVERSASLSTFGSPSYEITYQTKANSCFRIAGLTGLGGADAEDVEFAEADSPILGRVALMYTEFIREVNEPFLSFKDFQIPTIAGGSQLYSLNSVRGCQSTISLREAVRVVESLQYLHHPLNRK